MNIWPTSVDSGKLSLGSEQKVLHLASIGCIDTGEQIDRLR